MRGSFRVPKQAPGGGGGGGGGGTMATPRTNTSTTNIAQSSAIKQPKVETKMDISLFYQIYPEEILGSGQFGTVYGGTAEEALVGEEDPIL